MRLRMSATEPYINDKDQKGCKCLMYFIILPCKTFWWTHIVQFNAARRNRVHLAKKKPQWNKTEALAKRAQYCQIYASECLQRPTYDGNYFQWTGDIYSARIQLWLYLNLDCSKMSAIVWVVKLALHHTHSTCIDSTTQGQCLSWFPFHFRILTPLIDSLRHHENQNLKLYPEDQSIKSQQSKDTSLVTNFYLPSCNCVMQWGGKQQQLFFPHSYSFAHELLHISSIEAAFKKLLERETQGKES